VCVGVYAPAYVRGESARDNLPLLTIFPGRKTASTPNHHTHTHCTGNEGEWCHVCDTIPYASCSEGRHTPTDAASTGRSGRERVRCGRVSHERAALGVAQRQSRGARPPALGMSLVWRQCCRTSQVYVCVRACVQDAAARTAVPPACARTDSCVCSLTFHVCSTMPTSTSERTTATQRCTGLLPR
jgi:hypothetical protein